MHPATPGLPSDRPTPSPPPSARPKDPSSAEPLHSPPRVVAPPLGPGGASDPAAPPPPPPLTFAWPARRSFTTDTDSSFSSPQVSTLYSTSLGSPSPRNTFDDFSFSNTDAFPVSRAVDFRTNAIGPGNVLPGSSSASDMVWLAERYKRMRRENTELTERLNQERLEKLQLLSLLQSAPSRAEHLAAVTVPPPQSVAPPAAASADAVAALETTGRGAVAGAEAEVRAALRGWAAAARGEAAAADRVHRVERDNARLMAAVAEGQAQERKLSEHAQALASVNTGLEAQCYAAAVELARLHGTQASVSRGALVTSEPPTQLPLDAAAPSDGPPDHSTPPARTGRSPSAHRSGGPPPPPASPSTEPPAPATHSPRSAHPPADPSTQAATIPHVVPTPTPTPGTSHRPASPTGPASPPPATGLPPPRPPTPRTGLDVATQTGTAGVDAATATARPATADAATQEGDPSRAAKTSGRREPAHKALRPPPLRQEGDAEAAVPPVPVPAAAPAEAVTGLAALVQLTRDQAALLQKGLSDACSGALPKDNRRALAAVCRHLVASLWNAEAALEAAGPLLGHPAASPMLLGLQSPLFSPGVPPPAGPPRTPGRSPGVGTAATVHPQLSAWESAEARPKQSTGLPAQALQSGGTAFVAVPEQKKLRSAETEAARPEPTKPSGEPKVDAVGHTPLRSVQQRKSVSGVPVLQFLVDRLREHSAHLQGGLAQPAAGHGEGREELRTLRSICRHFVTGLWNAESALEVAHTLLQSPRPSPALEALSALQVGGAWWEAHGTLTGLRSVEALVWLVREQLAQLQPSLEKVAGNREAKEDQKALHRLAHHLVRCLWNAEQAYEAAEGLEGDAALASPTTAVVGTLQFTDATAPADDHPPPLPAAVYRPPRAACPAGVATPKAASAAAPAPPSSPAAEVAGDSAVLELPPGAPGSPPPDLRGPPRPPSPGPMPPAAALHLLVRLLRGQCRAATQCQAATVPPPADEAVPRLARHLATCLWNAEGAAEAADGLPWAAPPLAPLAPLFGAPWRDVLAPAPAPAPGTASAPLPALPGSPPTSISPPQPPVPVTVPRLELSALVGAGLEEDGCPPLHHRAMPAAAGEPGLPYARSSSFATSTSGSFTEEMLQVRRTVSLLRRTMRDAEVQTLDPASVPASAPAPACPAPAPPDATGPHSAAQEVKAELTKAGHRPSTDPLPATTAAAVGAAAPPSGPHLPPVAPPAAPAGPPPPAPPTLPGPPPPAPASPSAAAHTHPAPHGAAPRMDAGSSPAAEGASVLFEAAVPPAPAAPPEPPLGAARPPSGGPAWSPLASGLWDVAASPSFLPQPPMTPPVVRPVLAPFPLPYLPLPDPYTTEFSSAEGDDAEDMLRLMRAQQQLREARERCDAALQRVQQLFRSIVTELGPRPRPWAGPRG